MFNIDKLLRRLMSTGFRNALGGQGRAWAVLALAALLLRRARRSIPMQTVTLKKGESVLIASADAVEHSA
jgi:hypothetical protein